MGHGGARKNAGRRAVLSSDQMVVIGGIYEKLAQRRQLRTSRKRVVAGEKRELGRGPLEELYRLYAEVQDLLLGPFAQILPKVRKALLEQLNQSESRGEKSLIEIFDDLDPKLSKSLIIFNGIEFKVSDLIEKLDEKMGDIRSWKDARGSEVLRNEPVRLFGVQDRLLKRVADRTSKCLGVRITPRRVRACVQMYRAECRGQREEPEGGPT